jgi:hypothetical protein
MKPISTRIAFILVSLLTLVLLIGSTVLQQIVFRAEQHFSSLSLSPTTFRIAEGQELDLAVTTQAFNPVAVSGLQISLAYDAAKLSFKEAVAPLGWRTLALEEGEGRLDWVAVPALGQSPLADIQGEVTLGKVRFAAIGTGIASVDISQNATALAAADPAEGNFVYNAVESVQSSAGTITAVSESQLDFPEVATAVSPPEIPDAPGFGTQQIRSVYTETTAETAVIFVTLAYNGKATVEFGTTDKLVNRVESTQAESYHVLSLANLEPERRYYFRVIGEQTEGQSRIASATQTFETRRKGVGSVSRQTSEVIVFPQRAKQSSAVYIFPRNELGESVEATAVTVDTAGLAEAGAVRSLGGYQRVEVNNDSGKKQIVQLTPAFADISLVPRSLVFDPELAEPTPRVRNTELVLAWNQNVMALTLGGAILLFLLMLLFVKLAKSR